MPQRSIDIEGTTWVVSPAGRVTQYSKDEFALIFTQGTGDDRIERVVRYSPRGARYRELSLNELSDARLRELFRTSQPSWTAPETGYRP